MSLLLSAAKPRQLQYCAGGLRSDFRLLELDDNLLDSVKAGDVVIKGASHEDAVLCTNDKTYALKYVETTNTLLLLPPHQEVDVEFAAIPSLPVPGCPPDSSSVRDVGLGTQLQKNAAAQEFPALTATATAGAHLELVEIRPSMDQLPQLLGPPYSSDDDENQQPSAAAADDAAAADATASNMDVDTDTHTSERTAEMGLGSSNQVISRTFDQLLKVVQASRAELMSELQRLGAVQIGCCWRLVDPAYLGSALELLIASAMTEGWDLKKPLAMQDALRALLPEGYNPAIIQHCLQTYGRNAAQEACPTSPGPSPASTDDSSSSSYLLDERQVCLHYARKVLQQRAVWLLRDFMPAWERDVPGVCWCPQQDMLAGEALVIQPDLNEGISEAKVFYFPATRLPSSPAARFAALFAAQPRWTREQLDPYLESLKVPGQTVEMLLLKHARASQRSPTDATVVFVAR